jgi:hypothetical protein
VVRSGAIHDGRNNEERRAYTRSRKPPLPTARHIRVPARSPAISSSCAISKGCTLPHCHVSGDLSGNARWSAEFQIRYRFRGHSPASVPASQELSSTAIGDILREGRGAGVWGNALANAIPSLNRCNRSASRQASSGCGQ